MKVSLVSLCSLFLDNACKWFGLVWLMVLLNLGLVAGARAALNLTGTMLGFYPVKVMPSKTAIAPVNPTFLPRVRFVLDFITF